MSIVVRAARLRVLASMVVAALGLALLPGLTGGLRADAAASRVHVRTGSTVHVTRDGQRAARLAFGVRASNETGIAAENRASARASCRGCRAVAVSVQIVVQGHIRDLASAPSAGQEPSVIVSNVALSEDVPRGVRNRVSGSGRRAAGCSSCSSMALAYQFVVVGRHRLLLTPAAKSQLDRIETRMRQLATRGVSTGESNGILQDKLDAEARRISAVLSTGVVRWPHS
jgi:hypothetical protein